MSQSPECCRSDYSNLATDVNLNEVASGVGGWTQHRHPGTRHPNSLSPLLPLPPAPDSVSGLSEWVTPATPHAVGTNRGISLLTIAFFRAGATGRNGEEEVQEVSEPIWAR